MKGSFSKLQTAMIILVGVLMVALLLYIAFTPNLEVHEARDTEGYATVENYTYTELEDPTAPTGMVRQFRFVLDKHIAYDTTLVFFSSHQNVKVYLNGEEVYSMETSPQLSIIRTPGSHFSMVPLYREDTGKEVVVELRPVYRNYQNQQIEFCIGSKLAIYTQQLVSSLPEMVLSIMDVLAGLSLLGVAAYFAFHNKGGGEFYPLGSLAVSLGLWNFTQTRFAPLILPDKTVFVYYVSLVMLMGSVVPLIKSIKTPEGKLSGRMLREWGLVCSVLCLVQLFLQLFGVYDLRQMLKVTHGMIIVSALVLIAGSYLERRVLKNKEERWKATGGLWMLGVGVLLDMVTYYLDGSSGLLFVLVAILCFVLKEGIGLFISYVKQEQMLKEMETQLTLSRTTTMMSQIRSHFVFNILNAISGMCKYDPERADETVVRFARYLRNNIDIMEDDQPQLFSTELAHLEDYVVLEQVRFGDRIEFLTDVKTEAFSIPPLILQPVVENAIKHGISKKPDGGTVMLRTWEEGDKVKIAVEDNGVGFDLSELEKSTSVGIKNIRYRLWQLKRGTLDIESKVGEGTTVTITMPLEENL